MRTNEILIGLLAIKELELKTLKERIIWLESINQETAGILQDYSKALAEANTRISTLNVELNKLYALQDKDDSHQIGFNHSQSK